VKNMDVVLFVTTQNYPKLKEKLLKDDVVSRASIVFKDAKSLGFEKDGYYFYVSGTEEACNKALRLAKELAEKVENSQEIIEKIKEEEESAIQGFGGIFG